MNLFGLSCVLLILKWSAGKRFGKSPNLDFFWSEFSLIRNKYGALLRKSPYSVGTKKMRTKKIRIWALFT